MRAPGISKITHRRRHAVGGCLNPADISGRMSPFAGGFRYPQQAGAPRRPRLSRKSVRSRGPGRRKTMEVSDLASALYCPRPAVISDITTLLASAEQGDRA